MGFTACLTCDICDVTQQFGDSVSRCKTEAIEQGWVYNEMSNEWECHKCRSEYATVMFSVRMHPVVRECLSILEDGTIELTKESFALLARQVEEDHGVFSVAEIGCPSWAEEAGADPSLWRD